MLEQERRKRLHILSHCIAARVLIWRHFSAQDCLSHRMQMLLESILDALLALQQKLLPILGEVDKCQNRKGENDCTLYRTVYPPVYLLAGLLVHTTVFAVGCRCSWNQLSLLYEFYGRSCCLLYEKQINVDLFLVG